MNSKAVVIVAQMLIGSVSVCAYAGDLETLCAESELIFSQKAALNDLPMEQGPEVPAPQEVRLAASEYKKLAAAFEKGVVPEKRELDGWHAGRFFEKSLPDSPGSFLLAGGDMPPAAGVETVYKLVPLKLDGLPSFYETLDAQLAEGVALVIKDFQPEWTTPVFGQTEVLFERIMPSYNKGFSRFSVRKALDGRILVKHVWKDDMGGSAFEGVSYGYFTKDVTPKR